jgi:hypothetical protein
MMAAVAASMHEISHDGCTPKQGNLATVFMIVSIAWEQLFWEHACAASHTK